MLSPSLEDTLYRALDMAGRRGQKAAMLEHLLLALSEDENARAAFPADRFDLDKMRRNIVEYLDQNKGGAPVEAQPTTGFQRAVRRAELHAGERAATGADVLMALFSERETPAVSFLEEQGLTRFDLLVEHPWNEPIA